jgi:hypothetical protein
MRFFADSLMPPIVGLPDGVVDYAGGNSARRPDAAGGRFGPM